MGVYLIGIFTHLLDSCCIDSCIFHVLLCPMIAYCIIFCLCKNLLILGKVFYCRSSGEEESHKKLRRDKKRQTRPCSSSYTAMFIALKVNTIVQYFLHGRAKLRSIARGKYTTVYCTVSTTLMYTPTLHGRALAVSPFSYK